MAEKKRHRSPNFPYLDLEQAISRLEILYKQDRRAVTTMEAMLEHLGYSTGKSGSGGRVISSLRQYGLLDDVDGNFRVSEAGFRILNLGEGDPERLSLLKTAAIKPAPFEKVLKHYAYEIPSDTALKSYLVLDEGFNPDSVSTFIRNLRRTLGFAKLDTSDYNVLNEIEEAPEGSLIPIPSTMTPPEIQHLITPKKFYGSGEGIPIELADYVFSYQLSFPRAIRAEVKIYGKDLRRQDIERLQKEVGDLAGAFDEESNDSAALTVVESAQ